MLLRIAQSSMYINALGIVDAALDIAQGNNFTAQFTEQPSSNTTNVTKALDYYRTAIRQHPPIAQRLTCHDLYPARSCLQPSFAATNGERLTCNDGGYRISAVHRIGIHNPGHYLRICVHIGGRNI